MIFRLSFIKMIYIFAKEFEIQQIDNMRPV